MSWLIVAFDAVERQPLASAKDVTVIIPVSDAHIYVGERAVESASEAGATKIHIDNHHHGVCYARNTAIEQAETDLILPLDADDCLLPGAVERMAQAWEPSKVVYGGWQEEILQSDTKREHDRMRIYRNEDKQAPPPEMLSRKHICHATYLFSKDDWQSVGGYDPDFNIGAEDWAFMIALVNAGCELVRLEGTPLYFKSVSDNGRTHKAIRHKYMIQELLREKYPDFFRTP